MPAASDGTQAATARGWTLATSDEFAGTGLSNHWSAYDGPGNGGRTLRAGAAAPSVRPLPSAIMKVRRQLLIATGAAALLRITDRGPFIEGRVIDLSLAAAKQVDVWRVLHAQRDMPAWLQEPGAT